MVEALEKLAETLKEFQKQKPDWFNSEMVIAFEFNPVLKKLKVFAGSGKIH